MTNPKQQQRMSANSLQLPTTISIVKPGLAINETDCQKKHGNLLDIFKNKLCDLFGIYKCPVV